MGRPLLVRAFLWRPDVLWTHDVDPHREELGPLGHVVGARPLAGVVGAQDEALARADHALDLEALALLAAGDAAQHDLPRDVLGGGSGRGAHDHPVAVT